MRLNVYYPTHSLITGDTKIIKIRNVATDPNIPSVGNNIEKVAVKNGINF